MSVIRAKHAVLLPLLDTEQGEQILFEVRAKALKVQPGEICFPGGSIEKGETPGAAAVRETCEELLVHPDNIHIVQELPFLTGPGGAPVQAYVGHLTDYHGTFSRDEVDHILKVPLSWLKGNPPREAEAELITVPGDDFPFELIPGGRNYPFRKGRKRFYFYPRKEGVIWGLTAEILYTYVAQNL